MDTTSISSQTGGSYSTHEFQDVAFRDPQIAEEESPRVIAEIWEIYNSGKPFFTRESLQNLVEVFDEVTSEKRLAKSVKLVGVDGVEVRFEIQYGKKFPSFNGDRHESILTRPCLGYQTIQDLTGHPVVHETTAYLPITVRQLVEEIDANGSPVRPPVVANYADVEKRFLDMRARWEGERHFSQFRSILEAYANLIPPNVRKVVAFACCTLNWDQDRGHERSMYQHAMALYLRDFVSARQGDSKPIQCYAQDPAYNEVDVQVLEKAGFIVLDDPRAFLEVDETSIVLSFAPNVPIRQIVADLARPAMMVWETIREETEEEKASFWTDPVSPRVLDMVRNCYVEIEAPEDNGQFGQTAIYMRKSNERAQSLL